MGISFGVIVVVACVPMDIDKSSLVLHASVNPTYFTHGYIERNKDLLLALVRGVTSTASPLAEVRVQERILRIYNISDIWIPVICGP